MASLRITLRAGERIFVNGAVLRAERKTTLEFLNDVTFLLESHVMQANEATTPLRQLYFVVQMMLMDPSTRHSASILFRTSHAAMISTYSDRKIVNGLTEVEDLVKRDRAFEALKRLRGLIGLEEDVDIATTATSPVGDGQSPIRLAAGGSR